jgi:hypothetical protein
MANGRLAGYGWRRRTDLGPVIPKGKTENSNPLTADGYVQRQFQFVGHTVTPLSFVTVECYFNTRDFFYFMSCTAIHC